MTRQAFEDFINRQAAGTAEQEINWAQQRDEWLQYLDQFYETVKRFVDEYVRAGKIQLTFHSKEMHEEDIGEYEAKSLELKIGSSTIRFNPVGTNLIAAKGRVDMIGAKGTVKFVLVPKDSAGPRITFHVYTENEKPPAAEPAQAVTEWAWKISTPPPNVRFMEIEEESFYTAMMEVTNG